jgi:hypothetical protein
MVRSLKRTNQKRIMGRRRIQDPVSVVKSIDFLNAPTLSLPYVLQIGTRIPIFAGKSIPHFVRNPAWRTQSRLLDKVVVVVALFNVFRQPEAAKDGLAGFYYTQRQRKYI